MNAQVKEEWINPPPAAPERTGEISAALAKAQAEMANPGFDSTNPHFRNRFASLAAVRNAVVPVLAKHGIAMSQDLCSVEGAVSCTTILMHGSGQKLTFGPLVLPVSKNDAQGFGSAATYARRYSLMAVAGVVGDVDDDANDATGKPGAPETVEGIPPDIAKMTADAMLAIINTPAKDGDHEDLAKAIAALDYHQAQLAGHNELQLAAAALMTVAKKNTWKALITQARKAEAADRVTDPSAGRRF